LTKYFCLSDLFQLLIQKIVTEWTVTKWTIDVVIIKKAYYHLVQCSVFDTILLKS